MSWIMCTFVVRGTHSESELEEELDEESIIHTDSMRGYTTIQMEWWNRATIDEIGEIVKDIEAKIEKLKNLYGKAYIAKFSAEGSK